MWSVPEAIASAEAACARCTSRIVNGCWPNALESRILAFDPPMLTRKLCRSVFCTNPAARAESAALNVPLWGAANQVPVQRAVCCADAEDAPPITTARTTIDTRQDIQLAVEEPSE